MSSPGLRVPRHLAKTVRGILQQTQPTLLIHHFVPLVSETHITFPVERRPDDVDSIPVECEFVSECSFTSKKRSRGARRPKPMTYADRVREVLPDDEFVHFQKSYELVGSIAIINIPDVLIVRENDIAECLLSSQNRIRTVVKKTGHCASEFRVSSFVVLAGEPTMRTTHRELGLSYAVEIDRVFFSSRISQERTRLAELTQDGECVFVPFCGIGPFAMVIARRGGGSRVRVVGMELNPVAAGLARENVLANGMQERVKVVEGDVRSEKTLGEVLRLGNSMMMTTSDRGLTTGEAVVEAEESESESFRFDRVIAPMPRTESWEELLFPVLRSCCRDGTVVHLYDHLNEADAMAKFELIASRVREEGICSIELKRWLRVGQQHSPTICRLCYDFRVSSRLGSE